MIQVPTTLGFTRVCVPVRSPTEPKLGSVGRLTQPGYSQVMIDLCAHLGLQAPLIQAPMAGVQDHRLAAAVCAAGGLGSLPAAMLSPEALKAELQALTRATSRAFNVNFFCHAMADVLLAFKPVVVSFHFGLPAPDLMARVKSWGSLVLSSATTVAEARWLQAHGADAVVAQGLEAGGHRGMFLSDDLDNQCGTFALLLSTVPPHTALTNLFTGRPARGLVNRMMRELGPLRQGVQAFPLATLAIAPLRAAAEALGQSDFTPLWAGQNLSPLRAASAGEITQGIIRQWYRFPE